MKIVIMNLLVKYNFGLQRTRGTSRATSVSALELTFEAER